MTWIFISKALQNASIPVEGDGKQTRDFVFVDDVVTCNVLAATKPVSRGQVYNVGGGGRISIRDLQTKSYDSVDPLQQ